ncbi:hypothetical protein GXM_07803 [Nostoc sphaeroides CCNUC1]|uniref:Uncharacterized protein n=1 Tax=Nostoc sphaeroides CCNUC1 TaxID=2653204 RepID=A0A5P8WEI8_9NOSO|nr:hypothetical protein GXM_07803 [Nostoc sphaeroides CCNUC1]
MPQTIAYARLGYDVLFEISETALWSKVLIPQSACALRDFWVLGIGC